MGIVFHFWLLLLVTVVYVVDGFSIPAARMASIKPPRQPADVPTELVDHAIAWAASNGLGMIVNDDSGLFTSTHLPFSLFPYGEHE